MIAETESGRFYRFPNTGAGLEAAINRVGDEQATIRSLGLHIDRNITIPANITIVTTRSGVTVGAGNTVIIDSLAANAPRRSAQKKGKYEKTLATDHSLVRISSRLV